MHISFRVCRCRYKYTCTCVYKYMERTNLYQELQQHPSQLHSEQAGAELTSEKHMALLVEASL